MSSRTVLPDYYKMLGFVLAHRFEDKDLPAIRVILNPLFDFDHEPIYIFNGHPFMSGRPLYGDLVTCRYRGMGQKKLNDLVAQLYDLAFSKSSL